MMDWTTNQPNARFWVLKLIKDSFHPGDKLVETESGSVKVSAQVFVTPAGRKLLLVNKRNREIALPLPDAHGATALAVGVEVVNFGLSATPTAGTDFRWARAGYGGMECSGAGAPLRRRRRASGSRSAKDSGADGSGIPPGLLSRQFFKAFGWSLH